MEKNKPKIFLDFDETLVSTSKAFCKTYNEKYKTSKGFTKANYLDNYDYNFKDVCNLLNGTDDVDSIFDSKEFFNNLTLKKDCKSILEKYKDKLEYYIVTIGTPKNLAYKSLWISENLPFIDNIILLSNKDNKMDKSIINMGLNNEHNFMIDDHQDNLFSSNCHCKICMVNLGEKDWNKDWNGIKAANWIDIENILNTYYNLNHLNEHLYEKEGK